MKIFTVASNVPYKYHDVKGVTSVHVFTHALLEALLDQGHEIVLQVFLNEAGNDEFETREAISPMGLSRKEREELRHFEERGMVVLPPIYGKSAQTPNKQSATTPLGKIVLLARKLITGGQVADFYPSVRYHEIVSKRVRAHKPEVVFSLCSPEGLAALHGFDQVPKTAYQGDIDYQPTEMRLKNRRIFNRNLYPRNPLAVLFRKLYVMQFKQAHLRLMRDVDLIANLTASNAVFYTRHRHPRSVYGRNTWPDCSKAYLQIPERAQLLASQEQRVKIIGHVGYLNRTGSSFGLQYLLQSLPEIDEAMAGIEYAIHIIGEGEIAPELRRLFNHPRVVKRGYVRDLDRELESSDMFLMLNNAGPYQAAFTRHLVAWEMGLCLIVHRNSIMAIPEIEHLDNALASSTSAELAQNIYLAGTSPDLNGRIREGGRSTYLKYFTPHKVAKGLVDGAREVIGL